MSVASTKVSSGGSEFVRATKLAALTALKRAVLAGGISAGAMMANAALSSGLAEYDM
jgi:hypothetical protein